MTKKTNKQIKVFDEEFSLVLGKANRDGVSVQLALSRIIKEWKEYDQVHQSKTKT